MKEPNQQILFGTPLFTFETTLPQKVNDELTKSLLKMEEDSTLVSAKSNAGGWRSDSISKEEGLCFEILRHYTSACFLRILDKTHKHNWHQNSWAIINRKDDFNLSHSHANSDWSCVYYVDSGDKIENPKNKAEELSGNLILTDPRGSLITNSRTVNNQDTLYEKMFGNNYMSITPTTGLLVFFPSWLMHSVMPYKGTKPRIIIATNLFLAK